jgi:outer membrane protein
MVKQAKRISRRRRWIAGLLLGLAVGWAAASETGPSASPLSLDDCVRTALERNPQVQVGEAGVAMAKESVGEAKAPYWPSFYFHTGYARWETHTFFPTFPNPIPVPPTIGPTDDWGLKLTGRYLLFDSGARRAGVRAAEAGRGAAAEESERIRRELVLQVHRAFYNLAGAADAVSVGKENLARAEDQLRLAKNRKEAGAVPLADVLRAEVGVANARLELIRLQNQARIAAGALNTAMGLPSETPVGIQPDSGPPVPPDPTDLAAAAAEALRQRPEVIAAQQKVEASRQGVAGAKSAFGPRVNADAGIGVRDDSFFPSDPEWTIGVSIDVPVFTGFSLQRKLGRAKAQQSQDEALLASLSLKIRQEVWTAAANLQTAGEAIAAAEVLIRQADESLRLARERYEAGAGVITDLLDAETDRARAGLALTRARWDHRVSRAEFDWSTGSLGEGN